MGSLPRRFALGVVFAIALLFAIYLARGGSDAKPLPGQPLRELAKARGLEVGTAVRGDQLERNRAYRQTIAQQFSTVTPENEMKWASIAPERGEFDFGAADDIVEHARDADQKIRGHTLVWHFQLPDWVRELGPRELRAAMKEHIHRVVRHFRGDVGVWDVVNEPISDAGGLRQSVFMRRLGQDYIARAFRLAHEADPEAKLYLNEIGAEGINPKSNRLYDVLAGLKREGVPVDGVGFQVHANLQGLPGDFVDNMRRFADLGLDIAITEADVGVRLPATREDLEAQARIYEQIVRSCRSVSCKSLTFWGFTDGRSWISETQAGMGAATLLDENLAPKPAFHAVQRALGG
ncbi:MAG TPA: endo-1,4-beta-xylanase [Solirubrobacteraceae bacterium]|nr:endo-1,4-beta-xylanase [Solirubrobacteraceae bacterium]